MLALPPLIALVIIDYLKPQEFLSFLRALPLLYICCGLAILGFVLDVRQNLATLRSTPHMPLVIGFFLWSLVTVLFNVPGDFMEKAMGLLIPIALFAVIGHFVQTFRMFQILVGWILAVSLFLSVLGVYQGIAPYGCHLLAYEHGSKVYKYDGRACEPESRTCDKEDAEPGADYACEHVGLLGTNSDHGRVRYRGTLSDPNELSLVIGIAMPFAFALLDRRRTLSRQILLIATLVLVGLCAVYTQSRGGQLVYAAVMGVYFLNRFGVKGLIIGLVLALPILLLGGREGGEESTLERTECWYEGMLMFLHQPIFGVGQGQFTEHHFLTAHNSYVLAAAELGFPGMFFWSAILYLSVKIPVRVLTMPNLNAPPVARSWALALIAALLGLAIGIFFLSYCYKEFFWIYVGLSAAFYQAVRRHAPDFYVTLTVKDGAIVFVTDVILLVLITGYTFLKVG